MARAAGVTPSACKTRTATPPRGSNGTSTAIAATPLSKVARTCPRSPLKFPLASRPAAATLKEPASTPAMLYSPFGPLVTLNIGVIA